VLSDSLCSPPTSTNIIMKINKTQLHSLYDQYSVKENRLTHALLHTIASSEWLLRGFVKDMVDKNISLAGKTIEISTQKKPFSYGDNESSPEEIGSIPDAWIVDDVYQLGIAIEVKDQKKSLNLKQLHGHVAKIKKYEKPYLLIITPDLQKPQEIIEFDKSTDCAITIIWHSWDCIYQWLNDLASHQVRSMPMEDFLVATMIDYLERRKEVLGFQGIKFRDRFDVFEAKDILNAEMEELSPFVNELYKELGRRRPAITTFSAGSVWDCFGSEEGFTAGLHITLSIHEQWHDISLTVPNSATEPWKQLKNAFDHNEGELFKILEKLRGKVPNLFVEFNQRHFIGRKRGITDGFLEFSIDTLGKAFRKDESKVKEFPVWLEAVRSAIVKKKNINGQVMFKCRFYLADARGIKTPQFIDTSKETIKALEPLYSFLNRKNGKC